MKDDVSSPKTELFVDSSKAVSKMLSNTAQAITGCTYVPRCSTSGRPMNIVLAGGYNTGASGTLVNRHDFAQTSISIPWNFSSGDFRNRSQYTTLLLLLPCYGYLQLNTDNYIGDSSITIDVFQDSATGTIAYKGKDFYCTANMGCNVPRLANFPCTEIGRVRFPHTPPNYIAFFNTLSIRFISFRSS